VDTGHFLHYFEKLAHAARSAFASLAQKALPLPASPWGAPPMKPVPSLIRSHVQGLMAGADT
jgi:hypothetical protein